MQGGLLFGLYDSKGYIKVFNQKFFTIFCCMTTYSYAHSLFQNADYTTGQVFDLSEKLEQSEAQLGRGSFMLGLETHDRKSEDKLAKATRDRYSVIECFKQHHLYSTLYSILGYSAYRSTI